MDSGQLQAKSKWKDVYLIFKNDERYLNLLGSPGSNPIELFWDVVDKMDQKFDVKVTVVEDAIKRYNDGRSVEDEKGDDGTDTKKAFVFSPDTSEEDFKKVAAEGGLNDEAYSCLTENDIASIFIFVSDLLLPWSF